MAKNKNKIKNNKQEVEEIKTSLPELPKVEESLKVEDTTTIISEPVEVYQPSQNSDKYPEKKEVGKLKYKVITYRNDHVRLQEDVTDHLNDGWELVGGISTAFHADPYATLNMFSQALVKRL